MRTPFLTCIYVLTVLCFIHAVGCSRQDEHFTDIEGVSLLDLEHSSSTSFAELAWSPDGRSVAARAYTELNSGTVTIIDLLTGTARNIYDSGGAYMLGPEWSPDGQSLIFAAPTESIPHQGGVVVADADTGRIIHNLGFGSYATWTADLETVIVLGFDSSCREEIPIYEYNLTTGTRRILGSTISCFAESGDRLDASTDDKLVVADNTGMKAQILSLADGTELGALSPPIRRNTVWSPDGTILAFLDGGMNSQVEDDGILFASADGACLSEPLRLGAELLSLDWSPDGNQLIFSTREANRLYFLDLTTGVGKELMDSYRERCDD
jgi:Tol biopolymer transport system component